MYVRGLIRLCKVSQGPGEVTLAPIESISTTVMNPFYTKYLDVNQYPLSLVPSAIIEKHMGTVTTVNADGCVFEDEIIHWAISDNLYYKTKPSSFIAVAHPTALSQSLQTKVWKLFDYVCPEVDWLWIQ